MPRQAILSGAGLETGGKLASTGLLLASNLFCGIGIMVKWQGKITRAQY